MSIPKRCTMLGALFLNTVSQSGVVQFGDSSNVKLTSRALAVQRAIPDFIADEFHFESYSIFYRKPLTLSPCVATQLHSNAAQSVIQIGTVEALGVSASSLLRVGCGGPLVSEDRLKHIRHYNDRTPN
jgi:spore germination protein PE